MRAGRINLRRSAIPAGLVVGSFALAFAQRPGKTVFDTRIELSADASLFLHRVAQLWSSTGDLGHVQAGQFVGYLFPMAPWFAFVQWAGIPMWIGQRLWLGALIALAAWGAVRLMDALYDPRRGVAHLGAGALYAANPYVAVWTTRGSLALLAYAAVPWLMLAAHQGLLDPRGWRWPALSGLLLAATAAGVNAAIVLWVLPAPVVLIAYEAVVVGRGFAAVRAFGWRALVCLTLGAAWWVIPLLLQTRYGSDFLSFTELPSTVWATTSLSESFRLLGYWLLYLGLGGVPVVSLASTYLFSTPVILATFAVPLFAFGALRWTRHWVYAPFFCLLAVGALLAMFAGFPSGTPLRGALNALYFDLKPLRFMRTSYKAAPLVGISLACLSGVGLAALARRGGAIRASLVPATALVVVLFALPLFEGRAIDRPQEYGHIPPAWHAAVSDAERATPDGHRIILLPGELFGFYNWGETVSSIGPALAKRPVLIREVVPYADPHAANLQNSVDDLIQQGRLVPGQLPPLLRLMGVGQVLVSSDSLPDQSGALDPATLKQVLASQPGFERPAASYGPVRSFVPKGSRSGGETKLPELRRFATPQGGPGIVRTHPLTGGSVLDGDAQGIGELAAQGGLSGTGALFYAGDVRREQLARLAAGGAAFVFTDSNRRRVLGANLLRANQGATMGANDSVPRGWPSYDLFESLGSSAQTVARYSGLSFLRSPVERSNGLFPEHRAYAALDGRLDTAWVPTPFSRPSRRFIELGLSRPRPIESLRVHPLSDSSGTVSALAVSVNGGSERRFAVRPGWNTLPLGERSVRTLKIRIATVTGTDPSGGIDEVQIPGLRVRESLRLPTLLASQARGLDLSHSAMSVLLERTSGDFPYRVDAAERSPQQPSASDMVDAEPGLERDVTLPVGRSFGISGWGSVSPSAADSAIDRLAGMPSGWSFDSSGRFEGLPGRRASSAFDGSPASAWIAPLLPGVRPWLSVAAPRPFALDSFTIEPGAADYAVPSRVNVITDSGVSADLPVDSDGSVRLGRTVHTRHLRIEVAASRRQSGGRDLPAVAVPELRVASLRAPHPRRTGAFATRCGELTLADGGSHALARVSGTLQALDAGSPLRLGGCGAQRRIDLPAGQSHLSAPAGAVMRPDHLALVSGAPAPVASVGRVGRVTATSDSGRRVRLSLTGPSWLVFGQSYSSGWRASCRGRSGGWKYLGAPVPIDGFANGWRVDASCQEARFDFRPQRLVDVGYWISATGCIAMLLLLLVPMRRRRVVAAHPDAVMRADALADPLWTPGLAVALSVGLVVALTSGFLFGLRAGTALGPAAALLVLVGVSAKRLLGIATLALAAIPLIYLLHPASRLTDLSFTYATHHVAGHWAAVVAVWCVAAVALLQIRRLR